MRSCVCVCVCVRVRVRACVLASMYPADAHDACARQRKLRAAHQASARLPPRLPDVRGAAVLDFAVGLAAPRAPVGPQLAGEVLLERASGSTTRAREKKRAHGLCPPFLDCGGNTPLTVSSSKHTHKTTQLGTSTRAGSSLRSRETLGGLAAARRYPARRAKQARAVRHSSVSALGLREWRRRRRRRGKETDVAQPRRGARPG